MLIAFGGPPGAGKTTAAYLLRREVPLLREAMVLENDQVRRQLLDYDLSITMTEAEYASAISERVQNRMDELVCETLKAGGIVIDTSGFWSEASRAHIAALAADCKSIFICLWFDLPRDVLEARLKTRQSERTLNDGLSVEKGHASDAAVGTLSKYDRVAPLTIPKDWLRIDASGHEQDIVSQLCTVLNFK